MGSEDITPTLHHSKSPVLRGFCLVPAAGGSDTLDERLLGKEE